MMRRFFTTGVLAVLLLGTPSVFAQIGGGAGAPPESTESEQAEDTSPDETAPAEEPSQGTSPEGDPDASTAVSKASQERTLPGGTLAVISYILLWLMTLGFVGVTARRQSELSEQLDALEGRMDDVLGGFDDEV